MSLCAHFKITAMDNNPRTLCVAAISALVNMISLPGLIKAQWPAARGGSDAETNLYQYM